jgi:predicted nucleic acid-binding protein
VILVDTSAWVEFDRATGSTIDRRLVDLITTEAEIAVSEPIVMEVAAGARSDDRERDLRRLLARFHLLPFDPIVDFDAATRIYRSCRRVGVTPRGSRGHPVGRTRMTPSSVNRRRSGWELELARAVGPAPRRRFSGRVRAG